MLLCDFAFDSQKNGSMKSQQSEMLCFPAKHTGHHDSPRLTTTCQAEQQLWRAGYGVPVELFAPFTDSCVEVMKPLIEAFPKDVSRHGNC